MCACACVCAVCAYSCVFVGPLAAVFLVSVLLWCVPVQAPFLSYKPECREASNGKGSAYSVRTGGLSNCIVCLSSSFCFGSCYSLWSYTHDSDLGLVRNVMQVITQHPFKFVCRAH